MIAMSVLSVLIVVISLVYTECSVIRLEVIPLHGGLSMDFALNENTKENPVANIKIDMDDKKANKVHVSLDNTRKDDISEEHTKEDNVPLGDTTKEDVSEEDKMNDDVPVEETKTDTNSPSKLIDLYQKPVIGMIPDFHTNFGIRNSNNNNCPKGQVRRGPLCVNA